MTSHRIRAISHDLHHFVARLKGAWRAETKPSATRIRTKPNQNSAYQATTLISSFQLFKFFNTEVAGDDSLACFEATSASL